MAKVLITGSSKGIGYHTALKLARSGHEVIATMRKPENSDLESIGDSEGLPLTVLPMNVDDDASVADVMGLVGDSIDVLVNNAGIVSINVVEDEELDTFRRVMETNYFGVLRCTKKILPFMRERNSGCIINVSSISGRVAFYALSAYTASKFALEAYSESLAQEVRSSGIKVALIEPGIINTAMTTTERPGHNIYSSYPHGGRLGKILSTAQTPPTLVAEKIQYIIENDDRRLRFPTGPDAHTFIGWRDALSDEDWVEIGSLAHDADYFERVFTDTCLDLRPLA